MRNKPVHEIRIGRIRATIWAHQADGHNVVLTTAISRLYKDGTTWRDSTVFYRDDLPIIAKVADMAYAWIWSQEKPTERDPKPNSQTAMRN